MREIKFRSWDNRNKIMDYPDSIANGIDGDKYQIQQYTGLKDKNGKEIYEGDIVQVGAGVMFKGKLMVEWIKFGYALTAQDYINPLKNCKAENISVIGNIYENELK